MAQRITSAARRCCRAACIRTMPRPSSTVAGLRGRDRHRARRHARPRRRPGVADRRANRLRRRADPGRVRADPQSASRIADAAHAKGALLIAVVTEIVSLGLLEPPGAMGADIVAAEGQSIGNGAEFRRSLCRPVRDAREIPAPDARPPRAAKPSDAEGRRGYVLTLSTREQHIRREKATSNICTNSGLCCARLHHPSVAAGRGRSDAAGALNHAKAIALADRLTSVPGVELVTPAFFNEFTLELPRARGRDRGRAGRSTASSRASAPRASIRASQRLPII